MSGWAGSFTEDEEQIINQYKKRSIIYAKILSIIESCNRHNENDIDFFRELYEYLDKPEAGIKEISLCEMYTRGMPFNAAEFLLPDMYYRLISLINEPSSTELIKVIF